MNRRHAQSEAESSKEERKEGPQQKSILLLKAEGLYALILTCKLRCRLESTDLGRTLVAWFGSGSISLLIVIVRKGLHLGSLGILKI